MKIIYIIFILFIPLYTLSQEANCRNTINEILISKIKQYESRNLIPYYSKDSDKWGLMHLKTKKKLTSPIFRDNTTFNPNLYTYFEFENCQGVLVKSSVENYNIVEDEDENDPIPPLSAKSTTDKAITKKISGFEVSKEGHLSAYNKKFHNEKTGRANISGIFSVNGKYFAVLKNKQEFSIINKNGEVVNEFEKLKSYPLLKYIYAEDKDAWIYVKDRNDHYIFKSLLKGNEIIGSFSHDQPYWSNYAETFGYQIIKSGDEIGLLDLISMKWKIKPSKENEIIYKLFYTCSKKLSQEIINNKQSIKSIKQNRKIANIFIQSFENDVYDLRLNKIKPIE